MFRQFKRTLAVSILLAMALSACAAVQTPYRIVSFSSQTTAIVEQLGVPDHRITLAHGARASSGLLPDQLRRWVLADAANTLLMVGIEDDVSDEMQAMAAHPRVRLATYPGCNIVDVFAMYEDLGARLSQPDAAARTVRQLSTALGRISGSTFEQMRPAVIVVNSEGSAYAGTGLVGDIVEIGGGEHLLEHAGPPCSVVKLPHADARAARVLIDARRKANGQPPAWHGAARPLVVALPQLASQIENLQLVAAARDMSAALHSEKYGEKYGDSLLNSSHSPADTTLLEN